MKREDAVIRQFRKMFIESFLPDSVKLIVICLTAAVIILTKAARRYPHVEWLQKFHLPDYRTEEQKRRARRAGNIIAGIEMIGIGLVIPVVYFITTVMFFSEMSTGALLAAGSLSVLCIGFGVMAIAKSRAS